MKKFTRLFLLVLLTGCQPKHTAVPVFNSEEFSRQLSKDSNFIEELALPESEPREANFIVMPNATFMDSMGFPKNDEPATFFLKDLVSDTIYKWPECQCQITEIYAKLLPKTGIRKFKFWKNGDLHYYLKRLPSLDYLKNTNK